MCEVIELGHSDATCSGVADWLLAVPQTQFLAQSPTQVSLVQVTFSVCRIQIVEPVGPGATVPGEIRHQIGS